MDIFFFSIIVLFFFIIISRMNSIHVCALFEEDWLPWQMLDLMTMAASSSLHLAVPMSLIASTPSLERSGKYSRLYYWYIIMKNIKKRRPVTSPGFPVLVTTHIPHVVTILQHIFS